MAFDPDAYLAGKSATNGFDPDAYLAGGTTAPTYEPQVVTPDDIAPTPGELSTLAAPEGSPAREEINRAVAGNLFAPPGAFAREPTLDELIKAAIPHQRDEVQPPLAPPEVPLPEQGAFEQGGVLGVVAPPLEAAEHVARGLAPRTDTWGHLFTDIGSFATPAVGSVQELIQTPENLRQRWANIEAQRRGEALPFPEQMGEIYAAEQTPAWSQERANVGAEVAAQILMGKAIAGGLAQPKPSHLRTEPLVWEPPPTVSHGPTTIADDVRAALAKPAFERRFTLQPEPRPELAPAPSIEETLKATEPRVSPETGFEHFPGPGTEPTIPVPSETAQITPPPGTPLKATPLVGPNGETPAADVAAAAVEVPVQHGEFAQPGYTAVETAPEAARAPEVPVIPPEDVRYAGGEPPVLEVQPETPLAPPAAEPVPQAFSDEPHVSAIANRFTAERAARGELGEVQPGQTISTMDLVHQGLKMTPEQVNESVSRVMQGGDVNTRDNMAIRGEEARLSQRSGDLSRAARANPADVQAQLAADNAFKDLTDFHNGPVAQVKRNWHLQGKGMQGEIPVDLSTLNGMREAWFKDTGQAPPKSAEPMLQKQADKLARAIDEERAATRSAGETIEKVTRGRKLPTADEVRQNIAERMKVEPCII